MEKLIFLFILFTSCQTNHWNYAELNQSKEWSEVDEKNKECAVGTHQSPIDLSRYQSKKLDQKITINYNDESTEVVNNGHTIKEKFHGNNYIQVDKQKYFLKQLHFHTHSEHSLEGVYYPAEVHFVHANQKGELLVLGIFIEINSQTKNEFGFFKNIEKGKSTIKLSKIMELNGAHYFYTGSLTTPPCTENVKWVILDKHISLNYQQIKPFKKYYQHNYRPINNIKDHHLYHSDN